MNRLPIAGILGIALSLSACGGNSASANPPASTGPCDPVTAPTSPASPPSGIVSSASAVTVEAGRDSAGIDINVGAAPSSPPNAQSLGVSLSSLPCPGGSAFNTGDTIRRGQNASVLLFGAGLSHSMTVTVIGPPGVQVLDICPADYSSDNGSVPGMSFRVAVGNDAALGVRTVLLQNSSGAVTAFTGGLEVVP